MDVISSGDQSDDEPMSTNMLDDICEGCQFPPSVNWREAYYKIRDYIKQSQEECKGAFLSTRNMGKGLHKLFKAVGNYISQVLPILGESGSEVPCFIPEPRNFAEVTRLSEDIQKPWLKANMKEVKNLINDQTFLVQEPYKGDPVTPCMDVYKVKIQSDGILDTLKLRIVVIVDLYKKKLF